MKGIKYDHDKPEYSLIPPLAEEEVVKVLTMGAKKYSPENWRLIDDIPKRYMDAAMRHMADWRKGNCTDDESGLNHLAHAICCLQFVLEDEIINEMENEFNQRK